MRKDRYRETLVSKPWPAKSGWVLVVWACAKRLRQKGVASNRSPTVPWSSNSKKEFAGCTGNVRRSLHSGTSALQVSLGALKEKYKWRDGDEVIIRPWTSSPDVNILLDNRLTPVFVDVEPEIIFHRSRKYRRRDTKKTRAIIPVHTFGFACGMDAIHEHREKI